MTRLVTLPVVFDLDSNNDLTIIETALAPYYTLTPVSTGTPPPPPPPGETLKVVFAQNGATPLLPEDYSYSCTDARADISDGGNGNSACIKIALTGMWGGFQPSNDNTHSTDFSQCTSIVIDLKPTQPNQQWSLQFLKAGDTPIVGPTGQPVRAVLPGAYGPAPVVGQWGRYTIPKALLMTDYSAGTAVDVSKTMYKGAVQDQSGKTINVWYVDNWGGV